MRRDFHGFGAARSAELFDGISNFLYRHFANRRIHDVVLISGNFGHNYSTSACVLKRR